MITYVNKSFKDSPCQVLTYINHGKDVSVIFHDDEYCQWLELVAGTEEVWSDTLRQWLCIIEENYQEWSIATLALPHSLSMLPEESERKVLEEYLGSIPDLEVFVYTKE